MTGPDRRSVPLRVLVVAIGMDGLLALGLADLVSSTVTALAAMALGAGSYASYAFPAPAAAAQRKALSVAALLVVAGYAAYATVGQHTQTIDGVPTIGPLLAALLVGVQVAHSVVQNARRDLLVGLVISLFMTVLAAGLAPGPVVAAPLLLAWPAAITAMVLAHRLTVTDEVDAVAAPHRAGTGAATASHPVGRVAGVVAVCVLAGLAVFLLLPRPEGFSARSRLLGSETADQPGGGSTSESRSASYYTQGYLDLRARGGLSGDPVMEVPADSPPLWRSNVLDLYDGTGWQSSRQGGHSMGTGPSYTVPLTQDEIVPPGMTLRTDDVVLRSGWNQVVAGPGAITGLHADTGQLIQVGPALALFDVTGGMPSYTVTTVPEVADPAALRSATGTDTVSRVWTQLPSTVPLRVRQLAAELTANAATRYDAVDAVERYLRSNETYRLDSPVPAAGDDPVDDFLFVSHQGFCEQFASAAVVLLRARGVPARLVTGFGYGQPASAGRRVMLSSDAHAWIEVWYPGVGWSASDPTVGAALAPAAQPSLLSRVVSTVQSAASTMGGRILLAAGVVLLGLAGLGAVWLVRWLRRRRARQAVPARPVGPVLAAFRRFEAALAANGSRAPPAETLAERAFRLPGHARPAMAVLERECYAPSPPAEPDTTAAVATFERLTDELEATPRR